MYCKKNRATISINVCLLRQDIAEEKKKEGENLTSFSKCFNCGYGKKIRLNPNPKLDRDVLLLKLKYEKPKRQKLKIREKIKKYKLIPKGK